MRVQTIVYVTDMDTCVEWYRKVLGVEPTDHGKSWSSFRVGDANVALHLIDETPDSGKLELTLISLEPLEEVMAKLRAAGVEVARAIADETFGRSIRLLDPEGMPIQINEHDPELYDD